MSKPSDVWEIRHPTKAGVVSPVKNCGYEKRALDSIREHGYSLYCNDELILGPKEKKEGKA